MQRGVEGAVGTIEGMGEVLDEDEEEAEEPKVNGFAGMTSTQQEKDDHENGHRGEFGKQLVVDHV